MNEMTLLLALLVLSYFGNAAIAPGQSTPIHLPSGAHFILFGFLLGPHALQVMPADAAASFMPLAISAISWLALVLGTAYGFAGNRRLSLRAYVLGFVVAIVSASTISGVVYAVARFVAHMPARDAAFVGLGIGLAGCETTRQSVRWVLDRNTDSSPLLVLLEELSGTDELVPLLGLACFFAFAPLPAGLMPLPAAGMVLLTVALGALLGLTSALLMRGLSEAQDAWIILLGAALLGTGIAWRLSLSPLTTLFVMGISLSVASRHATELRPLLTRTAPGVLLPSLLLVGALLHVPNASGPIIVALVAVLARLGVRVLTGVLFARAVKAPSDRRLPFGFSLCCTGNVSVLVSLSFALRFPGTIGDLVLSAAVANGVAGDLFGTLGLRQTFGPRMSDVSLPVSVS